MPDDSRDTKDVATSTEEDKMPVAEVIAGSQLVLATAKAALDALDVSRVVSIGINNYLKNELGKPKFYCDSGGIDSADKEIPRGGAGFVTAHRARGPGARGTVGVIVYQIVGTEYSLAIMWSIPWSYVTHDNWFLVRAGRSTDMKANKKLFDTMYEQSWKAADGFQEGKYGRYKMSGVMGTSGKATLIVDIR